MINLEFLKIIFNFDFIVLSFIILKLMNLIENLLLIQYQLLIYYLNLLKIDDLRCLGLYRFCKFIFRRNHYMCFNQFKDLFC